MNLNSNPSHGTTYKVIHNNRPSSIQLCLLHDCSYFLSFFFFFFSAPRRGAAAYPKHKSNEAVMHLMGL